MDANAYLRKHGWRGSGHSLDKHDRGIKRPLLISHKQDNLGLGKKKAAHSVDDQWWMRAFDESLKNIGTGQDSTLAQIRKQGINRGGLYGFFVKGEGLAGTMENSEESSAVVSSASASRSSTPPTSASEGALGNTKESKKRKRADKSGEDEGSKKKKEKKEKKARKDPSSKPSKTNPTPDEPSLEALTKLHCTAKLAVERKRAAGAYGTITPGNKKSKYSVGKKMREDKRIMKRELMAQISKSSDTSGPAEMISTPKASKAKASKASKKTSKAAEPVGVVIKQQSTRTITADKHRIAITAKIGKLTVEERSQYEERAKLKNQSLEVYVQRRIEKKDERRAGKT